MERTGPDRGQMGTLPAAASMALEEILGRADPDIVGVVLSGSAARGMATDRSDVDVYVVRVDGATASDEVLRSAAVDEIPVTLSKLERLAPFGSDGWWHRWSFAWAQVLRDDTGGRVAAAVHGQATLTPEEQDVVLAARLDGTINLVYRALKADRDGRRLERRLDAAESLPWLLDVVFAFNGRVRPYNKYLPWELREHPLAVPEWSARRLLPQLANVLDGDPTTLREVFAVVERECRRYDATRGSDALGCTVDAWGADLGILRGIKDGSEP
jgi:predicted nucleotidyltransferase